MLKVHEPSAGLEKLSEETSIFLHLGIRLGQRLPWYGALKQELFDKIVKLPIEDRAHV